MFIGVYLKENFYLKKIYLFFFLNLIMVSMIRLSCYFHYILVLHSLISQMGRRLFKIPDIQAQLRRNAQYLGVMVNRKRALN